jgi:hypothetical protein
MKIKFEDAYKIKNPRKVEPRRPTPIEKLDKVLSLEEQLATIEPPEEILTDVPQPNLREEFIPCIAYDFSNFTKYRVHKGTKKSKIEPIFDDLFKVFDSIKVQPGIIINFDQPKNKQLIEFHVDDDSIVFNTVSINAEKKRNYNNIFVIKSDPQFEQLKKLLGV